MDIKIAQQMTITELVLENQKLKLDAQREAEHHDRMVGELEKVYKELDEEKSKLKLATEQWELCIDQAKIFERERNEARELIDQYRDKLDLSPISWDI